LTKDWDGKVLEEKARSFCSENNVKVGDYFMVLRIAVTGLTNTPPIWDVMEILGKKETLNRLQSVSNFKF
jgi:glutamyl-tRNA synthetase